MHQVLFGTALLVSFLGGVVALLAPCCVSVMLPAYLATGFGRRSGIAPGTGVFGAGVATLMVPMGLGASALSAALPTHHLLIFSIGGAAMLAGGIAVLAGWKPVLPMPSLRSPSGHGYGAAYGLGLFSGIASACCAPVLAGVVVLTGSAASFGAALAVSVTYVAGMVAPLAVLALVWEGRNWGASRLLHGRPAPGGGGGGAGGWVAAVPGPAGPGGAWRGPPDARRGGGGCVPPWGVVGPGPASGSARRPDPGRPGRPVRATACLAASPLQPRPGSARRRRRSGRRRWAAGGGATRPPPRRPGGGRGAAAPAERATARAPCA